MADAICLVYVLGVKDDALRDKLSEVAEPTLEKFNTIVKTYVQMKITALELNRHADSARAVQGQSGGRQRNLNSPRPP